MILRLLGLVGDLLLALTAKLRIILKICQWIVRHLLHHRLIIQESHYCVLRVQATFSHRGGGLLPLIVKAEVGWAHELVCLVPGMIPHVLYTRYVALVWRTIPGRFSSKSPLR